MLLRRLVIRISLPAIAVAVAGFASSFAETARLESRQTTHQIHALLPNGIPTSANPLQAANRPARFDGPLLATSATNEVAFIDDRSQEVSDNVPVDLPVRIDRVTDEAFNVQVRTAGDRGNHRLLEPSDGVLSWAVGEDQPQRARIRLVRGSTPAERDVKVVVYLVNANGGVVGDRSSVEVILPGMPPPPTKPTLLRATTPSLQVGEPGTRVSLAIRLEYLDGNPVSDADDFVRWSIDTGEARLVADGNLRRNYRARLGQGTAGLEVELPNEDGESVVSVRLLNSEVTGCPSSACLKFTVRAESRPRNPPPPVGEVVDDLCNSPNSPIGEVCTVIEAVPPEELEEAYREIQPEEAAALVTPSLEFPIEQAANIGRRLVNLRRGLHYAALADLKILSPDLSMPTLHVARQARAKKNNQGVFVIGSLTLGERASTDKERAFSLTSDGLTFGYDHFITGENSPWQLVAGAALGSAWTDLDLGQGDAIDSQSLSLSTYGTLFSNPQADEGKRKRSRYLEWVATYGRNEFDLRRQITLPGIERVARGQPSGDSLCLHLGIGSLVAYPIGRLGQADGDLDPTTSARRVTFDLFARVGLLRADIDGYREQGAGDFDLLVNRQEAESVFGDLGLHILYDLDERQQLGLRIASHYELDQQLRELGVSFANAPEQVFVLSTDSPDPDFLRLRLSWDAALAENWRVGASYEEDFKRDLLKLQRFSVRLRFRF